MAIKSDVYLHWSNLSLLRSMMLARSERLSKNVFFEMKISHSLSLRFRKVTIQLTGY
jgi:hypothetical protein